ncbi:MAG TPA: cytidylate kinase-like family protein [Candidatus Omnitrophota bacterium]|jgi:cytidylate kinase|nr:MAG: Cytidylate kinase [Candidatus Omnitrophica bacterium ADurb.Bin314]HOE69132.1 cytidylate kinase-like family protein [Candidatus Omnitrophota bacterium]HQB94776.1 cytidylate kinase-like family protein [Candidatus Omnitrophota bacterium]
MGEIEKLKSFIDTIQYREKHLQGIDPQKGRFPFLTISRETGAGGHNLAEKILELIQKENDSAFSQGWQICDQELCQTVAQDPHLNISPEAMLVSEYRSAVEDMISQFITGESAQEKVIRRMFSLIRDLALYGKSIIIGRGSTCLTQDLPLGVHVRLVASHSSRISLMMKAHGKDETWARAKIAEQDKAKAALVKDFFHKDVYDPLHYDAVWNTDRVSIDEIACVTLHLIKKKFEPAK